MPLAMSHRNQCAATACTRTVQPDKLMCMEHWGKVPQDLKQEVWRTYRLAKSPRATIASVANYADARTAAIKAVQ